MLEYFTRIDTQTGIECIETSITGKPLLSTPLLNKGTAFTQAERHELKILGKLPYRVETLEEQVIRSRNQFNRYTSILQKYIYLNHLHDTNEILFYKLISEDLASTLPIIYTPGVSAAVKEFSHEFSGPRGIYIAYPDRDKIAQIFENRTHSDIDLMVVTDGERILGIGDQGIGGMDIPIAKLIVYSLCGVNPYRTLPIMLDVGTDNPQLLNDPVYLGWRHPRIRGQEYDDFIHDFVSVIHQKFSKTFLHWEDFGQKNARRILETHRTTHCMFNDDMQGTGVVTLAALLAAVQATKVPLAQHRIIILGAGTAGVGIADQLYNVMVREQIEPAAARRQFWLIDQQGLLIEGMPNIASYQQPYLRPQTEGSPNQQDLAAMISIVKPTILIGCSTVGNAFTEVIVKAMASHTSQPIIFPLSNPNENCEADPKDLLAWTKGQALIATGSPYEPELYNNKTYHITQCNNALSFPGIGLGVIASGATQVTDNMLWAAAQAIASYAPLHQDNSHLLLPKITEIPTLANAVGIAVAKQAIQDGVATKKPHLDPDAFAREQVWKPYYRAIKLKPI